MCLGRALVPAGGLTQACRWTGALPSHGRPQAGLICYRRAPPPRLWAAQGLSRQIWCPFPSHRTARTRFAQATHPRTSLSTLVAACPTCSHPPPRSFSTISGIPVNRTIMWLIGISDKRICSALSARPGCPAFHGDPTSFLARSRLPRIRRSFLLPRQTRLPGRRRRLRPAASPPPSSRWIRRHRVDRGGQWHHRPFQVRKS
jgi:hypothetical protein